MNSLLNFMNFFIIRVKKHFDQNKIEGLINFVHF